LKKNITLLVIISNSINEARAVIDIGGQIGTGLQNQTCWLLKVESSPTSTKES